MSERRETATLAGGCFWCVEAVFEPLEGVEKVVSGYTGGRHPNPSYEAVCTGVTGHAEAVQVTFDPRQVSYGKLLQIFFAVAHDPTQLNRQGPDHGTQYRSALFLQGAQKEVAERYIAQLEAAHLFRSKIVTQLAPLEGFYAAEDYHQDYAARNPNAPYIVTFDRPKVANLQRLMPNVYRAQPVLVAARK